MASASHLFLHEDERFPPYVPGPWIAASYRTRVAMNNKILMSLPVAFAKGLLSVTCGAATITIGASRDATIFENNVDNGSGGGNGLFVGTNGAGHSPRRAPIAFDISGSIPAGSRVLNVQLTLHLGQFPNVGAVATSTIGLHRLVNNWGEGTTQQQVPPNDTFGGLGQGAAATDGDVTWNARYFSASTPTPWDTPGGDFAPVAIASTVVTRTLNTGYSWTTNSALESNVQDWLDNPSTNFGWMLVNADEITPATFRGFYSRQTATSAFRPKLSVTYALAADFDGNDLVDSLDLSQWNSSFGMHETATPAQGDANGDGDVDGADLLVWQRQFGTPPLMPAVSAVPEPSAFALASLVMVGIGTACARRRRNAPNESCVLITPLTRSTSGVA